MCVHRINIWDVRATASRRLSARLKLTSVSVRVETSCRAHVRLILSSTQKKTIICEFRYIVSKNSDFVSQKQVCFLPPALSE